MFNLLENVHKQIQMSGGTVGLSVLTKACRNRPDLGAFKTGKPGNAFSILLTYQPTQEVVDFAEEAGYRVMVVEDTHGGQVVIRWFGWNFTPVLSETLYLSGFDEVSRMLLSVNNGLGHTLAPVRYLAPSEVSVIVIKGV